MVDEVRCFSLLLGNGIGKMKRLRSYTNKRFRSLTKNLESYGQLRDPEVLHAIRVDVKKIKVVLNLMDASVKKFKGHRQFIPFRTIFRRAGEIRQSDVLYKLLLLYEISGVPDSEIPKAGKSDVLSGAFQKEVPQFMTIVKLHKKKLVKVAGSVDKAEAKKYLKKKEYQIKQLLFPSFSLKDLHKARKIAKELIYLRWLEDRSRNDAFYKDVEKIVGLWHDKQMLMPVLRKNKAADELKRLKTTSKADLATLKAKIAKHYK